MLRAYRAFLTDVELDGAQGISGFTLGTVQNRWTRVIDALLGILTDHGLDDDYLRSLDRRLRDSGIPAAIYQPVRDTQIIGLVEGWTPATLSRRIRLELEADETADIAARRLARTEATAAQAHTTLLDLAANNATMKRWVAHHDEITRPTHLDADGQTIPLAAAFTVGGSRLMYPADPKGPHSEVANCRCVIVEAIP
jgi:hypothetical protein